MTSVTRRRLLIAGGLTVADIVAGQRSPDDRLAPPRGKVDAIVDSDTYNEIDDQFAVAYALRSPSHMSVEAIYAAPFHNERSSSAGDGMRKSYDEILRILAKLNVKSQGFAQRGSDSFMTAAGKPVDSAAARDLIAKAMKPRQTPLYVITVGAPTNVSSAILMEPKIKDKIVVVWLGGQPYDWPTAIEFNLRQDLHASRVLHDSGVALVNIPTRNVSEHLRTTSAEIEKFLRGKSTIADYLCSEFLAFAKWKSPNPGIAWSKVIWDISAVAWLVNPEWIPTRVSPSPMLTDDIKYRNIAGRHSVRVAVGVNRDAIFTDLFRKLAA
jgi:inosine-uridine nucleoside N-ribohydrolase